MSAVFSPGITSREAKDRTSLVKLIRSCSKPVSPDCEFLPLACDNGTCPPSPALTVRLKDLKSRDIEHAYERPCARPSEGAIHPLDDSAKHLLVQALAERREFLPHLRGGPRLLHPLPPRFDFGSRQSLRERRVVHPEEKGDSFHLRAVDEVRLLGTAEGDVAEMEDRGKDLEQVELLGRGEPHGGKGALEEGPLESIIDARDCICRMFEILVVARSAIE